jgi:hypothetical protein
LPLPFDGRTVGEGAEIDIAKQSTFEDEEDEVIRIDDLYLHKNVVDGSTVSKIPTTTTEQELPRRPSTSSANARFYDSRSFDSLARSTDTGAVGLESQLERELPSFGTHRTSGTHKSHQTSGDASNGMSSYSQTYTPALSSYLYRHKVNARNDGQYGMASDKTTATTTTRPPTNRSTSMTSLLSWQSSSVLTTPTSNQSDFQVVQHCE